MSTRHEEIEVDEQQGKWPSLSEKERDRRWRLVKEFVKAERLDCLVVFGGQSRERFDRYLTNDRPGGVVIFPLEGELVHLTWAFLDLTSHLESALRGEASWVRDMRMGAWGRGIVEVLREKGYERANIGVVGLNTVGPYEPEGFIPYRTWAYILANLPYANFREVSTAFCQLIFVKSDEELQLVRRAAEIGELAAEAMMKTTRPGTSEIEIYAAATNQLSLNGARGQSAPAGHIMSIHSGADNPSWGAPAWLFRGQAPRVVKNGDVVQAEIFSFYAGMETQLQMSIAIEPVDSTNRECAAIARGSYDAGLKALRPGRRFGEVVEAMEEPLRQAKAWNLTPLIHSLNPLCWVGTRGREIPNLPGIEAYKGIGGYKGVIPLADADLVIKAGTVWELEPNACIGKHRVNIGGTVIVTEEGAVGLNVLSTEMRIIC